MRTKPLLNLVKRLHLCMALVFGGVFVMLGLTGSVLVWMDELDHALNPTLFSTGREIAKASAITPATVQAAIEVLQQNKSYGSPQQLIIPATNAEVIIAWYPAQYPQQASQFKQRWSRQVMLDPLSLTIKGERHWGEFGVSPALLMPTIFHLHRYVLLGEVGRSIISVSGLVLIVMALTGFLMWFPKATWKAWRQALTVNLQASAASIRFRLHRLLGVFALPVLLMLGFSGAYFNQPQWLTPVIGALFPITEMRKPTTTLANAPVEANISPAQALDIAHSAFPEARISRIGLPSANNASYEIRLRQAAEVHRGDGASKLSIDIKSGQIVRRSDPLRGQSGDRFLSWLFPLHSGMAFGLMGRIFICCFGVVPLILMWTGWRMWRKRHPVY